MCGLAGVYSPGGRPPDELAEIAKQMVEPLRHRGPDDSGSWVNAEGTAAFGFRRLSIIDLSPAGHQPMTSASGRWTVVFNGELYNFRTVRAELEQAGHRFRGDSDTEVLLTAVEAWGLVPALRRSVGMFAVALWDAERRELHLARDRLGIKPLFVAWVDGRVLFGSELKALLTAPGMTREVDPDSLLCFFRYLYVPGPASIFRGVRKIEPGRVMTLGESDRGLPDTRSFWDLREVARAGRGDPFRGSDTEAVDAMEEVLQTAVRQRMYADVPLGALLSGGIDSSLVVALMQRESGSRPVRTYSVAFEEEDYDEAGHAAEVARHLGTEHTPFTLTSDEAWRMVPDLPEIFDEPFASPSAIPNFLICRVARGDVTVALSGTGGDEVFAGYNRYVSGERLIDFALRVPRPARRLMAGAVRSIPSAGWHAWSGRVPAIAPLRYPWRKAYKTARVLGWDSSACMYRSLLSAWDKPGEVVGSGVERADPFDLARETLGASGDLLHTMLLADQSTYLVDDQLAKVDRVSMAVSLELRVPLLDHRVVELSWRLPTRFKRRDGEGKWVLRSVLERYVPMGLVDRPKMGLSVPLEHWLRGSLKEWASDTLHDPAFSANGLVNERPVLAAWDRFQRGEAALDLAIWASLMWGAWRDRWDV